MTNIGGETIKYIENPKTKITAHKLTQETLRKILHYNPNTGDFTWLVHRGSNVTKGYIAGTTMPNGYKKLQIDKVPYLLHRLAFLYMEGYIPEHCVDHIDNNPANNKWDNLREATKSCNAINSKVSKSNTSGVVGVTFDVARNKWKVMLKINKKRSYQARFNTFNEAVIARWKAEVEYKFPNCKTNSSAFLYLKTNNLLPQDI